MRGKGNRKVVDNAEAKKSYKFKADPLVMKVALEIGAKRQQCNKRITQWQREK